MKNRKIIFLLPIFGGGGGERVVSDLSLNLPKSIEKIIVAFESKNYYPYKGRLISLNIPLSEKFLIKPFIFLRGFLKFKKIIAKEKPDYVISLGNLQNIINILTSKNAIIRVDNAISESHQGFLVKIYPLLVKILFNKAAKIIVVSKGLKQELIENFRINKEKINLIYNAIDIKKIQELSLEPLEYQYEKIFKYPVIINIGSLIDQKGQWHLIRAFYEVKKIKKDLKLVILGEGKLENYLKELVEDLRLKNDVYFLGWQKNPFKFLARSKLFVFSSLWEGLGIVILEAMACKIPIISSDCKFGPREILAPGKGLVENGILVPPGNEKLLAEAMVKLLNNKKLLNNLKLKGGQRAEDFDIKKNIKEYDFLINN